jgi:hypothetical protein
MKEEMDVLVEQLDELLADPILDSDDALELAIVAGLAARLGAPDEALREAIAWREGPGREMLDETWEMVDFEPLLEALDACTGGDLTDEEVEEALYDVDDVIAAAIWCGRPGAVRPAAQRASRIIREIPDPFAPLADLASQIARLPAVAADMDLYDYWFAVADARAAVGEA